MELQPFPTPLYLDDGAARAEAPPGVLALAAPADSRRGRHREFIFIHLSLSGAVEENAARLTSLPALLAQRFFDTPGSVTAALRDAIQNVNQTLLQHNLATPPQTRTGALVCAVLRAGELYTAQVGEGLSFISHSFGLERLPSPRPAALTPLGVTAGLDIRYYHHWLQEGDGLLLADPRLDFLPTASLAPALAQTTPEERPAALVSALHKHSARLLLVAFQAAARPPRLADEPTLLPQPLPTPTRRPVRSDEVQLDAIRAQRRRQVAGRLQAAAPTSATPTENPWDESEEPATTDAPLARRLGGQARHGAAQAVGGLSRFTGWLARLLARLKTPEPEATPPTGERVVATLLAILIPVVVALIFSGVYFQRSEVSRLSELRIAARVAYDNGQAAEATQADARPYYEETLRLAAEALTLRPDDPEMTALQQSAAAALDRLAGITRLAGRSLYTFEEGADLTSVELRPEGGIYVLDSAHNRVTFLATDAAYVNLADVPPEQVLAGGDVISNRVAGDLQDLVWRPRGLAVSQDGIAMLDAGGALISYHPTFAIRRAAALDLASQWRQPLNVATYRERLYVLDPATAQIWRYLPNGDGFTIEAGYQSIVLEDLDQAVDMAIYSDDGSVVVAYQNGGLRRFASGRALWQEEDLLSHGLSAPLIAPTAVKIVGSGLNASIFVADPGSQRIVQISLAGITLAEYKATAADGTELFSQVRDIAVAETPLRLFVVSGNTLSLAVTAP